MENFREVSKEQFYKIIGVGDVVSTVKGKYPYTTEFKLRYGRLVGKTVDSYEGQYKWPVIRKYYISNDFK